jgi:hypothetical protein
MNWNLACAALAAALLAAPASAAPTPGFTEVWMWDGCDAAGDLAPPGAYRVRAAGAHGGASRSRVRVR